MTAPSLYADLSHYYDELCSNINYQEQCEFTLRAHRLWGNGGVRHLDLACGSGTLLAHFVAAGCCSSGLDISADMLQLAAKRCAQAQFIHGDMSALAVENSFDVISCFLYSMHYNASIAALQTTFRRLYSALATGGVLCFDAVDKNSIANDSGHTHTVSLPLRNLWFQTRWHYAGAGDVLNLHIHIVEESAEERRRYVEQHKMVAVTVEFLVKALQSVGFEVELFEHDFSRFLPWQGSNGNVIVCAIKN